MRQKTFVLLAAVLCGLFAINRPARASSQTTAFTYQGQLFSGGSPAEGSYDLKFAVFLSSSGGTASAPPVTNAAAAVSNGLFTVALDFGGGVFAGATYWLEISVRSNSSSGFATLSPRQEITPAPYALYAPSAGAALSVPLTALPGTVLTNGAASVNLSGIFNGNGSGLSNVPGTMTSQTVSGSNVTAGANQAYTLINNNLTGDPPRLTRGGKRRDRYGGGQQRLASPARRRPDNIGIGPAWRHSVDRAIQRAHSHRLGIHCLFIRWQPSGSFGL
ncbi:MAG TPA: hypothetical protein VGO59_17060 [Verrucomicrobiae bacterium]|jgi:hypothetical protein